MIFQKHIQSTNKSKRLAKYFVILSKREMSQITWQIPFSQYLTFGGFFSETVSVTNDQSELTNSAN